LKLHQSSAGSFITNEREAREKGTVVLVHHVGESQCGAGKALSEEKRLETARGVERFLEDDLHADRQAAEVVERQLLLMPLSTEVHQHASFLHGHHKKLGIEKQLIIAHDVKSGELATKHKVGNWNVDSFKNAVLVACADARHVIPELTDAEIAALLKDGRLQTKGREQAEQSPQGYYLGEHSIEKKEYNQHFTITGMSPARFKELLKKAKSGKLTAEEKHELAAVALSVFYYAHHKWPGYEKLVEEVSLKNR
jgi:hypothetical protein